MGYYRNQGADATPATPTDAWSSFTAIIREGLKPLSPPQEKKKEPPYLLIGGAALALYFIFRRKAPVAAATPAGEGTEP